MDPNHVLPRTYEWNAAVERSLGDADSMALTYLGAAGRKLMRKDDYFPPNPNFPGEFDVMRNGASSSYQALLAQFGFDSRADCRRCFLILGRIRSTMFRRARTF